MAWELVAVLRNFETGEYDAAATDLRGMFTANPDFTPFRTPSMQFTRTASPAWLALTTNIDFSRPDVDEAKLFAAIMKSEGLPRRSAIAKK